MFGGFALLVFAAVAAGIYLWKPMGTAPGGAGEGTPTAQAAAPSQPPDAAPQPAPAAVTPGQEAGATPQPASPAVERTEAVPPPRKAAAAPTPGPGGTMPAKKAGRRTAEPPPPPARPRDLGSLLAQARSAMIKGDYLAAISSLETILKADPNYQDAGQMLDMAKAGARNAAQLAVDTGAKSEMAGDYDTAVRQYEQALQLDPSSQPAADAMKRVRARMQADGEDAFKRARQFDALGRSSDAIAMYEKAIKLLPPDHASAKTARERLAALRGGN